MNHLFSHNLHEQTKSTIFMKKKKKGKLQNNTVRNAWKTIHFFEGSESLRCNILYNMESGIVELFDQFTLYRISVKNRLGIEGSGEK